MVYFRAEPGVMNQAKNLGCKVYAQVMCSTSKWKAEKGPEVLSFLGQGKYLQ